VAATIMLFYSSHYQSESCLITLEVKVYMLFDLQDCESKLLPFAIALKFSEFTFVEQISGCHNHPILFQPFSK
jgi:hypothetical protein